MKLQTSFKYTVYQNTFLYEKRKSDNVWHQGISVCNFFFKKTLFGMFSMHSLYVGWIPLFEQINTIFSRKKNPQLKVKYMKHYVDIASISRYLLIGVTKYTV